jgi:cytochrome P450
MATVADLTNIDAELARLFGSDPAAMDRPELVYRRLLDDDHLRFHRYESAVLFSHYEDVRALKANSLEWIGASGVARDSRHATAYAERLSADDRVALQAVADFENLFLSRTGSRERWERLRRISHRAFTPRRVQEMHDEIVSYLDELLAPLAAEGECDLAELCYRLPLMVIASILGIDPSDHARVHEWTGRIARSTWRDPARPERLHESLAAIEEFRAYVDEIVERHRRDPDSVSDLVAALLDAEADEQAMPAELTALFVNFLFAGHETTSNLFSIGLAELLRHRDQYDLLAGDPSLAPRATEELLRFVSPAQFAPADIRADFELGGFRVEKGETVMIMSAAANRDQRVFSDPDRLDLRRENAKEHLAFGFGPRYCLGQALARLEAHVFFSTVPARFPGMELATKSLSWHGVAALRRLEHLPVRLGC